MRRKFGIYAFPAFTLLLGMLLSGAISTAATLSAPPPFAGGNTTGCYSTSSDTATLKLGGRTVPPNSILRVSNSSTCLSGETALGLAAYSRTVLVSATTSPTNNGENLRRAFTAIQEANPAPTAANPYLVKVEPGLYDLGNQSLTMLPYVDLEGSGEDTTTITSAVSSPAVPAINGTVTGANNSEIRFLKIANTGTTGYYNNAIFNSGLNNTARLTHVTVTASNGVRDIGITNISASPIIQNVNIIASGGTAANYGIFNTGSSSPIILNSDITATGGTNAPSMGIYNINIGSFTVKNTSITAVAGSNVGVYGINNNSSSAATSIVQNSTIVANGGSENMGIINTPAGPLIVQNSTLTGYGPSSAYNVGIFNGFDLTVQNSTLKGYNTSGSATQIYSIYNSSGTSKIGASQLDGPIIVNSGTLTCAASYKANFTATAADCT